MRALACVVVLCCVASVAMPRAATSQTCVGVPTAQRAWVMGAYGWESSPAGAVAGADAGWRVTPRVSVMAGAERTDFDAAANNRNAVRAGVAYAIATGTRTAVCLTSHVVHESLGDLSINRVPVGIAAGWTTAMGDGGKSLSLHVEPSYAFEHAAIGGFTRNSGGFTGRGGISLAIRSFVAGIEYEHGFGDNGDSKTLARLGLVF